MKSLINNNYSPNSNFKLLRENSNPSYIGFNQLQHQQSRQSPFAAVNESVKNKVLRRLSGKALKMLASSMKLIHLKSGDGIYQAHEKIHFVYFPETAVCAQFEILENGKMIALSLIGREGATGVSSLFNSPSALRLTQVLQAGTAWRADAKPLASIIENDAESKQAVCEYLNHFINQILQNVVCHGFHQIEERLCTLLLMLQDRTGANRINLTHEQISLSLGTLRPSITMTTQTLREKQAIDYSRGRISIVDRQKLETLACSCYSAENSPLF